MKTRSKPPPPNPLRVDPSRTQTLRRAFAQALARRFMRLKGQLLILVDRDDELGLRPLPHPFTRNAALPCSHFENMGKTAEKPHVLTNAGRWRFHSDADKISAFRDWLRSQIDASFKSASDEEAYRQFLKQGFQRGAGRAFDDVRARRFRPGEGEFYRGSKEEFLRSAFGRPVATEKLDLISRVMLNDLDGVTDAMEAGLVRALAQGLAQGKGPRDIARDMTQQVDIGRQRAETIAQTEIIRTHAEGQLLAFEQLGVEELGVAVEWLTTGDAKVCAACKPLQGVVLKTSEAHGMLPRHPRCRCSFTPWLEPSPGEKRSKAAIEAAVKASQARGSKGWGPGEPISPARPESILNASGAQGCAPGPLPPELLAFSRFLSNVYDPNQPRVPKGSPEGGEWRGHGYTHGAASSAPGRAVGGASSASEGHAPAMPKVGETVKIGGDRYVAEPFDGDDTFPPMIASYEVKGGHIFYTGRNGSEGVVTGSRADAERWMKQVREEVQRNPPADAVYRPWTPADGGQANVAAAVGMVERTAAAFGIKTPAVELGVVKKPMEAGEHSDTKLSLANPHLSTPDASFNFKIAVSKEVHTAAHETAHAAYSHDADLGKRFVEELKASGEYVSVYHALAGPFEGLMDLGAAYVHSPEELKRHSPKLYNIAERWANESKRSRV